MLKSKLLTDEGGHTSDDHLRNEFNFLNVHGIRSTSGLLQSK